MEKKRKKVEEKIYVMSDIEMGRGDITDDFIDDDMVASFIEEVSEQAKKHKVTLVLNGDIFDFLKMAYKGTYPYHITEEISLWKLREVMLAHPRVFEAWKKFMGHENAHLFFVIGNHDYDLIWPNMQEKLREVLAGSSEDSRIQFGYSYERRDLYAEHGHMQDPIYAQNTKEPFIEYDGKKILNLPWGSYITSRYLIPHKHKFPIEERHFPNPLREKTFKGYRKEGHKMLNKLYLHSLVIDPILHRKDPMRKLPSWKIARHVLKHGFEFTDDEKFVKDYSEQVAKKNRDKQLIILGHAHVLTDMMHRNHRVIITDTWRDERDLSNLNQQKPKTYAEITYANGRISKAELKEWSVKD